jgi:hypothetical protein
MTANFFGQAPLGITGFCPDERSVTVTDESMGLSWTLKDGQVDGTFRAGKGRKSVRRWSVD